MAHTLREARESKGISQTFVARELGYNLSYYNSRIEGNKDYIPKLDVAYKLSMILNTPIDELFPGVTIKK